jgi:hypothetical protein
LSTGRAAAALLLDTLDKPVHQAGAVRATAAAGLVQQIAAAVVEQTLIPLRALAAPVSSFSVTNISKGQLWRTLHKLMKTTLSYRLSSSRMIAAWMRTAWKAKLLVSPFAKPCLAQTHAGNKQATTEISGGNTQAKDIRIPKP